MSITDELLRLDHLREDGVLSADDFMQAMANMLAGCAPWGAAREGASAGRAYSGLATISQNTTAIAANAG